MNTAVAAARLGAPAAFCGRISTDRYGPILLEHLRDSGVRLDLVERGPEPTALAHVEYDPTPVFRFEGDGTADTVLGPIDLERLDRPPGDPLILHSGSLALFRGTASEQILTCFESRAGATLRSFDPNVRPFAIEDEADWRTRLDRWLAATEVIRSSDEDLRWIDPSRDPLDTASQLLERGPAVAVVTHGPEGATVLTAEHRVRVPARPVEVVDTVGAGDSFTGGLLAWLHDRRVSDRSAVLELTADDWRDAVGLAITVAGITCGRAGADPPRADEFDR